MKTSTRFAIPFLYALVIAGCSNESENYPKEFIGFERRVTEHTCDTNREEETISLKIIAGDKQDKDRKLTISSNQNRSVFKIENPHPVIYKGKKSAKVLITIYPKKVNWQQRIVNLTCRTEGKDAKVSEISIRLQKK